MDNQEQIEQEEQKFSLLGVEMSLEEFDRLLCEQAQGKELKVINGQVVAEYHVPTQEEIIENQIAQLKQKLVETDYQAIKYAEGELSEYEYAPIKTQRAEWRRQINELEKKI